MMEKRVRDFIERRGRGYLIVVMDRAGPVLHTRNHAVAEAVASAVEREAEKLSAFDLAEILRRAAGE